MSGQLARVKDRWGELPTRLRVAIAGVVVVLVVVAVLGGVLRQGRQEAVEASAEYEAAWAAYEEVLSEWDGLAGRAHDVSSTCEVDSGAVPGNCSALEWIANADDELVRVSKVDVSEMGVGEVMAATSELTAAQVELKGQVDKYAAELSAVEATIDLQGQAWRNEVLKPELERCEELMDTATSVLEGAVGENQAVVEDVQGRVDALRELFDSTNERLGEIGISEGRDLVTSLAFARAELEASGKLLGSWPGVAVDVSELQLDTDQNKERP